VDGVWHSINPDATRDERGDRILFIDTGVDNGVQDPSEKEVLSREGMEE
jgi:hypothetical protein